MINKTQLMKGILEGCVLAVLSREKLYSQEIPKKLLEYKMSDVSDGTLFLFFCGLKAKNLLKAKKFRFRTAPQENITAQRKRDFRNFENSGRYGTLLIFR